MRDQSLESLAGQNTEVRGNELVATSPGRPTERGPRIDVLPVFAVEGDLFLVFHLMIAGRFRWKPPGAKLSRKMGLKLLILL